jgi:hypothetical protein
LATDILLCHRPDMSLVHVDVDDQCIAFACFLIDIEIDIEPPPSTFGASIIKGP